MLESDSSFEVPEEMLFFGDFGDLRLLKLPVKLAPSDGPPMAGGKTPIGKDIFGQPDAYLFMLMLLD